MVKGLKYNLHLALGGNKLTMRQDFSKFKNVQAFIS